MILPASELPLPESVDQEEEEREREDGGYGGGHQPQSQVTDAAGHLVPLVTHPLAARVPHPQTAAALRRGTQHCAAEDRKLPEASADLRQDVQKGKFYKLKHMN